MSEGRGYIGDDEVCPFCQQKTISESFQSQLESFFDETFMNDINDVKNKSEEYQRLTENLYNIFSQIEDQEKDNKLTKLKVDTFSGYLKTLLSQLASNKEILHTKNKEPSRSLELVNIGDQLKSLTNLLAGANEEIDKHNEIVKNYAEERAKLIQEIWKFILEENKLRIQNYEAKIVGLQKGVDALTVRVQKLRDDYKALDIQVKELTKKVTSVQPSIDEINKTLKSYGFLNFEIVPAESSPNQYQIQREDGTLAESTLSEGEVTFITFLYFLQLAKGGSSEETVSGERILIIDDPISSLDSNVLFVVSTLLKEIMKKVRRDEGLIRQVILLTHNVYFHKEVSFIDGKNKVCPNTTFWILRKNNNKAEIQCFENENPIKSSYDLLWQELRNRKLLSGVTIQNTMRRIIENYFKILGKYGDDKLIQEFKDKQEQEICRSLLCWINDGSHSINDDLFIEVQDDIIEKYFVVFKSIFLHTNHIEHFNMMMREEDSEIAA